jgi:outer membrane protein assembly factor BamA
MRRACAVYGMLLAAAVVPCATIARGAPVEAPPATAGDASYVLTADGATDSLLARIAGQPEWRARRYSRSELTDLCERLAAARAAQGNPSGTFRLTLVGDEGAGGGGRARIELADAAGRRPSRLLAVVQGAPWSAAQSGAIIVYAARGEATPGALRAGVEALREEALRRGHANAEAALDSLALRADSAIAYVTLRPGPVVRVESLVLEGAPATRPAAAQSIAGLRRGVVVTPAALAAARERLEASGLFVTVGSPVVAAGATPAEAQITIPVEERRVSRFEGAVGVQQGAGATGLLDLALGNIAGSGRGVGLRWRGLGAGRSEYAARYREPALLGRPLDGAVALQGSLAESLYTQTRWDLRLGAVLGARTRASLGVEHSGTDYTGAGSGTSGTWAATGGYARDGLEPRINPARGTALRLALSGGRRTDRTPGLKGGTRGLARVSAGGAAAIPLGRARSLHASIRAERTALEGEGGFPAEELLYLGGSEGLRGHADRAYGGDRILATSLEHRWLGSGESRAYVFLDTGYHGLGAPLATGSVLLPAPGPGGAPPAVPSSLARTQLSEGWEIGYGAGLVTRMAAGSVGIELGFAPGASVREGKLHLRYASQW